MGEERNDGLHSQGLPGRRGGQFMNRRPPGGTPPRGGDPDPDPPTNVFHVVGGRTMFIDRDRRKWMVLDYSEIGDVIRLVPVGTMVTDYRMFVASDGTRRRYSFSETELRELDPARVAAQFAAAVDAPGMPDAS